MADETDDTPEFPRVTTVRNRRRLVLINLTLLAVIALMAAALAEVFRPGTVLSFRAPDAAEANLPDPAALWPRLATLGDSPVHILLLGVDRRGTEQCRSDAMAILRCESDTLSLISVPRDAVVHFNGSSSPQKINAAYAFGGAAMAMRETGKLLGITCDGYVTVDFVTFVKVAQTVKTLTLDGKLIGAEDLLRDLDGLLTWLRSRSSAGGDNDRMKKHQLFIVRGFAYMLKLRHDNPDLYATLVRGALSVLETDLIPEQVLALSVHYRRVAQGQIERFVMPGTPAWLDAATGEEVSYEEAMQALHGADTAAAAPAPPALPDPEPQPRYLYTVVEDTLTGETVLHQTEEAAAAPPRLILSFVRLEPGLTVARLLARHRAKGETSNYTYERALDVASVRVLGDTQ